MRRIKGVAFDRLRVRIYAEIARSDYSKICSKCANTSTGFEAISNMPHGLWRAVSKTTPLSIPALSCRLSIRDAKDI